VIVVTGHQEGAVREALAGLEVIFVSNPQFALGLAGSLAAGIAAVPADADGALVCLGDMPFVAPADIDRLIAAFSPADHRLIAVPTHAGRQGNPVLWARRYFPELLALSGDQGAKPLLSRHVDAVVEIAMPGEGVLRDFDTPESLAGAVANTAEPSPSW
jgi:molybdenum cofactor cytidylyltransferase